MVMQTQIGAIGPIPASRPANTLPASIPAANRFFPPTTSNPAIFFFLHKRTQAFAHSSRILTPPRTQTAKFLFCRNEPKD
jgi:hypothetical protein